jgi:hypothetical protein
MNRAATTTPNASNVADRSKSPETNLTGSCLSV